jgi:hypothetical protein
MPHFEILSIVSGGMFIGDDYVRWYYEPATVVPRDDQERQIMEWLMGHGLATRTLDPVE